MQSLNAMKSKFLQTEPAVSKSQESIDILDAFFNDSMMTACAKKLLCKKRYAFRIPQKQI